jgi:D-alanyl-D-alanine-carboxypeptidase/D-alanyl-D-alanine-endopeptidase
MSVGAKSLTAIGVAVVLAGFPFGAAASDIGRIVEERLAAGFGTAMVIGVVDNGVRTFASGGSGPDGPVGPDTHFEIASLTKVLTTSLLAVLAEGGEVSLDGAAASLWGADAPRLPERDGRPVTLADLASHIAGLPKMPDDLVSNDPRVPEEGYTAQRLYAFLAQYEAAAGPSGYTYSNIGMALLGEALGQSSGVGYARLLHDRLLTPLGMASTALSGEPGAVSIPGYDDTLSIVPAFPAGVFNPAGGAVSTAKDLLTFADAYLGHGAPAVVKALAAAAAFTVSDPISGRPLGLGWDLREFAGRTILTKDGSAAGYSAFIAIDIANNRAAVVLSNGQGAVGDIALNVLDPQMPVRTLAPTVAIDAAMLEPLVGIYEGEGTGPVVFTSATDRLYIHFGDLPAPIRLFPESTTRFVAHAFDGAITFHRPISGTTTGITAVIDGQAFELTRRPGG